MHGLRFTAPFLTLLNHLKPMTNSKQKQSIPPSACYFSFPPPRLLLTSSGCDYTLYRSLTSRGRGGFYNSSYILHRAECTGTERRISPRTANASWETKFQDGASWLQWKSQTLPHWAHETIPLAWVYPQCFACELNSVWKPWKNEPITEQPLGIRALVSLLLQNETEKT